jgi:hypothetical protein
LTYHNDWGRTGQNLNETTLTPANVNPKQFGLIYTFNLDSYTTSDRRSVFNGGDIYGQPLYVPDVTINGVRRNVLYVVTQHDTVFAFDADADVNGNSSPLWGPVRFIDPDFGQPLTSGIVPIQAADTQCNDIHPEIGITSTPVIDPSAGVMYLVARNKDTLTNTYHQWVHGLDITTGLDVAGSPVEIKATVPGTGWGSRDAGGYAVVDYDPLKQNQRPGLALVHGVLYVASASLCDDGPYHGWLVGFDTTNMLSQVMALNVTPNDGNGGIWGGAPAIDTDGSILLTTGNGAYKPAESDTAVDTWIFQDGRTGIRSGSEFTGSYGDTVLRLAMRRLAGGGLTFRLADWFTPFNQGVLAQNDADFGSGGAMIAGGFVIANGKEGRLYALPKANMGRYTPCLALESAQCTDAATVQSVDVAATASSPTVGATGNNGAYSTPTQWNNTIYVAYNQDYVKAYSFSNGVLSQQPVAMSNEILGFPGATLSISANGNQSGVLWGVGVDWNMARSVLYAWNASDISRELYKSSVTTDEQDPAAAAMSHRDDMAGGVKFAVPTIYNGKVYVGGQHKVYVYDCCTSAARLQASLDSGRCNQ